MRIELHPDAAAEVFEATDHYEEARPGWGGRFLARLQEVLDRLEEHPNLGPRWEPNRTERKFRRAALKHFPYGVFYEIGDDVIYVLAVGHSRRESGYWLARLG